MSVAKQLASGCYSAEQLCEVFTRIFKATSLPQLTALRSAPIGALPASKNGVLADAIVPSANRDGLNVVQNLGTGQSADSRVVVDYLRQACASLRSTAAMSISVQ